MFKPVNRHILIELDNDADDKSAKILLPDDYKSKNPFGVGKAVDVASDCTLDIFAGEKVVYSTNMLENVTIGGKDYFLLLENYVLGVINEKD